MEQTFYPPAGDPNRCDAWRNADELARPAILLVEDDRDIRDMMTTLLDLAGFAVVACETAETGLNALREQKFDLVLSDYALPGYSGAWLLETAEAEGLLEDTPVLMVTAHSDVNLPRPYEVVQKPFDLDDLVERILQRLEGDGPRRPRAPSLSHNESRSGGDHPDHPEPVELILYATARSAGAAVAVENLRKVLARFSSSQVKLTVCELPADASDVCVADPAALPQTLVRGTPGARTFILGHITNPELMLELLGDCETGRN